MAVEQRNIPPMDVFANKSLLAQNSFGAIGEMHKVEYPDEGDIFVHHIGYKYPSRGFPYPEAVLSVHIAKKMIMATAVFVRRHYIFSALFVLLVPNFITKSLMQIFGEHIDSVLSIYRLEERRHAKAVRELIRAGRVVAESRRGWLRNIILLFTGMLASMLQWDNSYLWRFQDVFVEIIKDAFIKNPSKEIERIYNLALSRDLSGGIRFKTLGGPLRALLFLKPGLKSILIDFVKEVNMDEIKMDESDEYNALGKSDYSIHGWPIQSRFDRRVAVDKEYRDTHKGEIEEQIIHNQQLQVLADMQAFITHKRGAPLYVFYAVEDENGNTRVDKIETPLATNNPMLKKKCLDII